MSDGSSDVCSSALAGRERPAQTGTAGATRFPAAAEEIESGRVTADADGRGGQPARRRPPPRTVHPTARHHAPVAEQLGRASCRVRVCQYGQITTGDVPIKKNITPHSNTPPQ